MTPNNYPEGLDELATEVADNIPECVRGDSHWDRLYDFEPAELRDYARALLDALAERGYVLVDAKKQEPVGYLVQGKYKGELIAKQFYWTEKEAQDTGTVFLQHYPEVSISPVRAMLSAVPTPPTQPQGDGSLRSGAEHEYAIKEGARISACEWYFNARPEIDSLHRRRLFEAGFDRGYDSAMEASNG